MKTEILSKFISGYRLMIEDSFENIKLSLWNQNEPDVLKCETWIQSNDLPNLGLVEKKLDKLCSIKKGDKIVAEISSKTNSFGFDCDRTFKGRIELLEPKNSELNIFENFAADCVAMDSVKLSIQVIEGVSNRNFVVEKDEVDMDQPIFLEYESFDRVDSCKSSELSVYGSLESLLESKNLSKPLIYVDKSFKLKDGFLEYWEYEDSGSNSDFLTAVWRKADDNQYKLICSGIPNNIDNLYDRNVKKVYPYSLCKVNDGDYLGFIGYTSEDSPLRISSKMTDKPKECSVNSFTNLNQMLIKDGGYYSAFENMCDKYLSFPLRAGICLTFGNGEECSHGKKKFEPELASQSEIVQDDQEIDGWKSYIDLSSSLNKGTLLSWKYSLNNNVDSSGFFPVVWKKLDDELFKIACYSYYSPDIVDIDSNELTRISKPKENCYIDNNFEYFVGFIEYGKTISIARAVSDENSTQNTLIIVKKNILKNSESLFMEDVYNLSLESDDDKIWVEKDVKFVIDVTLCKKPMICNGNFTVETESMNLINKTVLFSSMEDSCIESVKFIASEIQSVFYLGYWEEVKDSEIYTDFRLIKLIELVPNNIGLNTINLEMECFKGKIHIGFTFDSQSLPFLSTEEQNTEGFIAILPDMISNKVYRLSKGKFGAMPVEICKKKYIANGLYYIEDQPTNYLVQKSENDEKMVVNVLLNSKISTNKAKVVEFSVDVTKTTWISFLAVEKVENSEEKWKILRNWDTWANKPGYNLIKPESAIGYDYEDYDFPEGAYLAIIAPKDTLKFANIDEINQQAYWEDLEIENNLFTTEETFLTPIYGVRLEIDSFFAQEDE
ncbi:MAG: hypothetical protein MHPSP_000435 [Paramarteilia canceri]